MKTTQLLLTNALASTLLLAGCDVDGGDDTQSDDAQSDDESDVADDDADDDADDLAYEGYPYRSNYVELEGGLEPPFPIVLDTNLAAVRAYKIEGRLAKPTAMVIDREGTVRYAYVGTNKTDRPSVQDLLSALDALGR